MQIEDFIYDAAVLRMGVCLERFLKHQLNVTQSNNRRSMGRMIDEYYKSCTRRDRKTRNLMRLILKERNKFAHASDEEIRARLTFEQFQDIRQTGLTLDQRLGKATGYDTGMLEIMISSSLPYDMGNAGDLLKHGALATFVDWFLEYRAKEIRYADPFGGRPWGYIFKDETRRRMEELSSSLPVIQRAQPDWRKNNKYYGSSHVVRKIAEAKDKDAVVFASDKDKLARSDLTASGISQIEDHDPENGFGILDKKHDERFNLIFLDPFADFLRDEFGQRQETPTSHFESISKSVERNLRLCVMLFVLDMKNNNIHDGYVRQRSKYSGHSFFLRCPKMESTGVGGESRYNMEVLLISRRFAARNDSVIELKRRLGELRRALEDVLPNLAGKIEFRSPDWLDRSLTARGT